MLSRAISNHKPLIIFTIGLVATGAFFVVRGQLGDTSFTQSEFEDVQSHFSPTNTPPSNTPDPDEVKAVHLSYGIYNSSSFEDILNEVENSDINSIVFEIKEPLGNIAINSDRHVEALEEVIPQLKEEGIYTIARIVVFEDSHLATSRPDLAIHNADTNSPWHDYKGLYWADPTNRGVWDYNLDIIKRAAALGFNEINLDYIRFPSDGPVSAAVYDNLEAYESKSDAIGSFLEFMRANLHDDVVLSIDVFGMIFISDQHTIGQSIAKMAPHVDVIMPMSYPSHYPPGFRGLEDPAEHPHIVVFRTLESGIEKIGDINVIVRPWIQDFDLGAVYDDFKIQEQIRASNDFQIDTWALWNAGNRYTWSSVR